MTHLKTLVEDRKRVKCRRRCRCGNADTLPFSMLTHSCIVFQKWNTTFLSHYNVHVMWDKLFVGPKPLYRFRKFILWYHLGCPKVTPPSKVTAPTTNKQCETRRNKKLLSLNCVYFILLFCTHIIRF